MEKVADWYSKLSFKAFQGGTNNARLKLQTIERPRGEGEELDESIKTKMPMPYTLSQHLTKTFQDHVGTQLKTVPDANEIYVQFKKDIEHAYREGIKEYLYTLEDEVEQEEVEQEEVEQEEVEQEEVEFIDDAAEREALEEEQSEEAFLEEWLDEIEVMPSNKRREREDPIDKPIDTATGETKMDLKRLKSKLKKDPILADVSDNELMKALEEYTRIPGDSQAEMVLRYELGLPPKSKAKAASEELERQAEARIKNRRRATASFKRRTVKGGSVMGPYDTQALKQKILSAIKTHVIDDNQLQTIIIDSIVADIHNMAEKEAAEAIARKMEFSNALAEEGSLDDVMAQADMLGAKLASSVGLPGDLVFLELDGDYVLAFAFDRDDAAKLGLEAGSSATAKKKAKAAKSAKNRSLPQGPQGVLSKLEQSQIEKLAALGKSKNMRDIKKASAKVAAYLGDILKNLRSGRIGIAEGTSKLRANMGDVIAEVFGLDGLGYYQYLTKQKKRA